jgi:hypothetical protein
MTTLSIQQAARQIGIDRASLYRHIRQGRVSVTVDAEGHQRIDSAELLRTYGDALKSPQGTTETSGKRSQSHGASAIGANGDALQAQIDALKLALDGAQAHVAECLRREERDAAERDRLLGIVEQQSRLLAAPSKKRGFFDFFTG